VQFSITVLENCTSFYVVDDTGAASSYGVAPISYADGTASGGTYRGHEFDESGSLYNVTGMCAGTYYVWVRAYDITPLGAWSVQSYGFWDYTAGDALATADWNYQNTFGWQVGNGVALTAGDHVWKFGSMPDGGWVTIAWDQIVITTDPAYTPVGIVVP